MASQISSTCTTGRQGLPSLIMAMRLVVQASAREVVEDDVEAHPRRRAICGGVAQEHGAEVCTCHPSHIALHQYLAFGVRGLRVRSRGLVEEVTGARAVHAAGRGVDEAPDADGPGFLARA